MSQVQEDFTDRSEFETAEESIQESLQDGSIHSYSGSRPQSIKSSVSTLKPHRTKSHSELYEEALQREISRTSERSRSRRSSHNGGTLPTTPDSGSQTFKADVESDNEKGNEIDISQMDWDSDDDPGNPMNWSLLKKWTVTMVVAGICLVVTFGSSLFVCGVPDIMLEMGISQTLGLSGLTFYLVGLAFGPTIAAPLSEVFGRKIVYVTSLPISMLFIMGVGLSSHIREILVLRFFAGFFSSPAMAIAAGSIADMWSLDMMGIAMSAFCLAPFAGPVLGPVIGGYVAENKGWKWTLWVNLMAAGAILFPVLLIPETYKPTILRARAKKRGITLKKPQGSAADTIKVIIFITLLTPMKMLVTEPIVMVFSIYTAFVFAVLFGFFEAYPVIFRGVYQMSLGNSGLAFLGIGVGLVAGTITYILVDRLMFFPLHPDGTRCPMDKDGNKTALKPEKVLIVCKMGAIALPISLFWIGWTARVSVHWMAPIAAGVPFGFGLILIFFSVITYFSMSYPPLSVASALAANNLLRYILASVFPLFTVQMYKNLGIGWASSLFAFIAVAMVPVPWIFEYLGPRLRAMSKYAPQAQEATEEVAV